MPEPRDFTHSDRRHGRDPDGSAHRPNTPADAGGSPRSPPDLQAVEVSDLALHRRPFLLLEPELSNHTPGRAVLWADNAENLPDVVPRGDIEEHDACLRGVFLTPSTGSQPITSLEPTTVSNLVVE